VAIIVVFRLDRIERDEYYFDFSVVIVDIIVVLFVVVAIDVAVAVAPQEAFPVGPIGGRERGGEFETGRTPVGGEVQPIILYN
jgi:hypothetical protein